MTNFSAWMICGNPVTPSVSATGVSTRTMLAPGAIVCAYSTSSVVSPAQLSIVPLFGSNGGTGPAGWIIVNDGGAGMPNCPSYVARSFLIVGEPKESTMTIVAPLPVTPLAYSAGRSYACWTCGGS